jgi:hypothetical protein
MALPAIQKIKPANRYNIDEAGIMEGIGSNGLLLGSSEKRFIQKKYLPPLVQYLNIFILKNKF